MRAITTLFPLALASLSQAQTLFSEDFEGAPACTLNTADASSVSGVANTWVVNDVFAGGSGTVDCSGFPLDFSIPATAAQPVDISAANGNYLHTASLVALQNNILNCSFGAADGFCTTADDVFARMSTDVSTIGSSDVTLKFWWLCNGGTQNYGELYYSVNAGSSWQQVTVPLAQYRNTTNWGEQTVTLPAFGNQATLRFGFRFHNGASFLGGSDPGFAIDDVRIIAADTDPVSIATSMTDLAHCQGAALEVEYTVTGTFDPDNMFTVQLSDANGGFAAPTTIGMAMTTTGGTIGCVIPAGTPPGTGYRIRVVSDAPAFIGTDNGADIIVYEAPDAGLDGTFTLCAGDDAVPLTTGGDAGGTWTGPSPVIDGQFDPATMVPGTYTYTVLGSGPCASDAAVLQVTVSAGANAGTSASVVICKNTGIYDLFQFLGGSPDTGGTWTGPGGGSSDGQFDSATNNGGLFTYTVDDGGSCGADEAVVSVTVGYPGAAGPDGTWTVCSTELPVDLFDLLDVSANQTGTWFNNGIPFDGEAEAGGNYVYIDYADQPCTNDTAFITLVVSTSAYAGENGTAQICSGDPPQALIGSLGGGPQPGGTWTGPGGSPHSGTFIPGTDPYGLYTYTVDALEPCEADEAVVAVLCEVGIQEATGRILLTWLGQGEDGQHLFRVPELQDAMLEMLDASGRSVWFRSGVSASGPLRVDTRGLGAGMYSLRVRTEEGQQVVRFVQ